MSFGVKIIARVAVFAALVFVLSYFAVFLYNVNPAFFIVFSAGYLWGIGAGAGVGIVGFFLWSNFNPMGPVPFPLLISQLIGISFSALIGGAASKLFVPAGWNFKIAVILVISGFFCGLLYHIAVDVVDALLYQPFWPRLIGGAVFSLITILSNCIIFPLLYPALVFLYAREKRTGL
jgi:hypothetical protein